MRFFSRFRPVVARVPASSRFKSCHASRRPTDAPLRAAFETFEPRRLMASTVQILHASDFEAGVPALEDAPRFSSVLNALRDDFANTLTLSSGDNWIPSPFYTAAADPSVADVLGAPGKGRGDVAILNALGIQAAVFGNHEFDEGPDQVASILAADGAYPGTAFPYLSANLDFTGTALEGLVVADGQPASPNSIAKTTVLSTADGEQFGVVGITTPLLPSISSPGGVIVSPADPDDLAALAALVQPAIDALEAAGIDKIIALSHLQDLNNEVDLAPLLSGVDVLIGGGGNQILADATDRLRAGDEAFGDYPIVGTNADGDPIAILNTDGNYRYVGRLVVEFNDDGTINPASIDPAVSGAFAADEQGVADAGGSAPDARVTEVVDALRDVISVKDGNTFGRTSVFLNGTRASVRTQETNLGNLSADANLFAARQADPSAVISIKNGGGIRDNIGEVDPATGEPLPPQANEFKDEGEVSQLDIENALRFNNGLSLLSVTAAELTAVIEAAIAGAGEGSQPGSFPQVSGIRFSFDATREPGARVVNLVVADGAGDVIDRVVDDGAIVGDAGRSFRLVTLDFLAGGGDGSPFASLSNPGRVDLVELAEGEEKSFETDGAEQQALAQYLAARFSETPFAQADAPAGRDGRIQNLAERSDTIDAPVPSNAIRLTRLGTYETGIFDGSAAEIVAFDPGTDRLFVVNAAEDTIDVLDGSDPSNLTLDDSIDLSDFGTPNSVDVRDGLVAVAVQAADVQQPGIVRFYDAATLELAEEVAVGALPDMLLFTSDGTRVLVANEGEPSDDYAIDPEGSVSIIDVADFSVTTAGFGDFNDQADALRAAGVRIFGPGATVAQDFEPEYITLSQDGSTAYVALQENNALAVIDVDSATVTDILPLGTKDFSLAGNGIDASDDDGRIDIAPTPVPVFGLYMPDGIDSYTVGGETFIVTDNEGDARDYDAFSEEARLGDEEYVLAPDAFPDADALKADDSLGRLKVTTASGDADGDGDFGQVFAFGARSFSIFTADGELVFDSGSDFERITAEANPRFFNASNDNNDFDDRSDDKGPEPEGVVLGEIGGRTYAFIGLERVGGVMVYDVSDPTDPSFVQYVNNRDFDAPGTVVTDDEGEETTIPAGDLGPEGLLFVSAADSPTGGPLLLVANETSGTVTSYAIEVGDEPQPAAGRLLLVDTESDEVIQELADGDEIDLTKIAARELSVQAVFDDDAVRSVVFDLNGRTVRTENVAPYALFRNNRDNFFAGRFGAGEQTVVATGFDRRRGRGEEVAQLDVSFTFVNLIGVDVVRLFDAAGDIDRGDLKDGDTIYLGDLRQPTVFVKTDPGRVGSVQFEVNGRTVNVENIAPYTLFRNLRSDFFGRDGFGDEAFKDALAPGTRTLTITPFSGHKGFGVAGESVTMVLDVVDARRRNA